MNGLSLSTALMVAMALEEKRDAEHVLDDPNRNVLYVQRPSDAGPSVLAQERAGEAVLGGLASRSITDEDVGR